jgi:hypothetical protein
MQRENRMGDPAPSPPHPTLVAKQFKERRRLSIPDPFIVICQEPILLTLT